MFLTIKDKYYDTIKGTEIVKPESTPERCSNSSSAEIEFPSRPDGSIDTLPNDIACFRPRLL